MSRMYISAPCTYLSIRLLWRNPQVLKGKVQHFILKVYILEFQSLSYRYFRTNASGKVG